MQHEMNQTHHFEIIFDIHNHHQVILYTTKENLEQVFNPNKKHDKLSGHSVKMRMIPKLHQTNIYSFKVFQTKTAKLRNTTSEDSSLKSLGSTQMTK